MLAKVFVLLSGPVPAVESGVRVGVCFSFPLRSQGEAVAFARVPQTSLNQGATRLQRLGPTVKMFGD